MITYVWQTYKSLALRQEKFSDLDVWLWSFTRESIWLYYRIKVWKYVLQLTGNTQSSLTLFKYFQDLAILWRENYI